MTERAGVSLAVDGAGKYILDMNAINKANADVGKSMTESASAADQLANAYDKLSKSQTKAAQAKELPIPDFMRKGYGKTKTTTAPQQTITTAGTVQMAGDRKSPLGDALASMMGSIKLPEINLPSISGAVSFLGDLKNALQLVGMVVKPVIDGIKSIGSAIIDLGSTGATYEGLARGFDGFANSMEGGSRRMLASMQEATAGTVKNSALMQQFNTAASLVSRDFATTLPDAMKHFGKIAASTGADIDYLMDSYVRGVGRLSPMILDNLQVSITQAQITAKAAEMFDVAAKSTTKYQQQMAAATLVTEQMSKNTAGMADVSESASAGIARIGAQMSNIKETLSQAVLPAFASVTNAVGGLVSEFSAAISEGGVLYPVLTNLGAVASMMADQFSVGINRATEWLHYLGFTATQVGEVTTSSLQEMQAGGTDALETMGTDFESTVNDWAQNALDWGMNVATSFAQGIIDGAAAAMTTAMNFIGGMLSGWLEGHSPPKVAPDLTKWGHEAIGEFLLGMTQGNFDVLESIQGPLKSILSGKQFANVSEELIRTLGTGDRAGAFDAIAKSAGTFATDLHRVLSAEFAVKDAEAELLEIQSRSIDEMENRIAAEAQLEEIVNAVADAERNLKNATEGASDAQSKVAALTDEYNQMLRSGASDEALKAQLARINAAEKERDAELDKVNAAESALDIASDQEDAAQQKVDDAKAAEEAAKAEYAAEEEAAATRLKQMQDELKFQQAIVKQLTDIAKIRTAVDPEKTMTGPKGAATPTIDVEKPNVQNLAGGIASSMGNAIDLAKEQLKAKWGEMWAGMVESIGTQFEPLKTKWDEIVGLATQVWETKLLPFYEDTLKPAIDSVVESFGKISAFWEEHGPGIMEAAGRIFGSLIGDIQELASRVIPWLTEQFDKVADWFTKNGPQIEKAMDIAADAWDWLGEVVVEAWDVIEPLLGLFVDAILGIGSFMLALATGDFSVAWEDMKDIVTSITGAMGEAFQEFLDLIVVMLGGESWQAVKDQWDSNWEQFKLIIATVGLEVLDFFIGEEGLFAQIGTAFEDAWKSFTDWGGRIVDGVVAGVKAGAGKVWSAVTGLWKGAAGQTEDDLDTGSPSKVYARYGEYIGEGAAIGIDRMTDRVKGSIASMFNVDATGASNPVPPTMGANDIISALGGRDLQPVPASSTISVTIGPNYVTGDDRTFNARTEASVRRALRSKT